MVYATTHGPQEGVSFAITRLGGWRVASSSFFGWVRTGLGAVLSEMKTKPRSHSMDHVRLTPYCTLIHRL